MNFSVVVILRMLCNIAHGCCFVVPRKWSRRTWPWCLSWCYILTSTIDMFVERFEDPSTKGNVIFRTNLLKLLKVCLNCFKLQSIQFCFESEVLETSDIIGTIGKHQSHFPRLPSLEENHPSSTSRDVKMSSCSMALGGPWRSKTVIPSKSLRLVTQLGSFWISNLNKFKGKSRPIPEMENMCWLNVMEFLQYLWHLFHTGHPGLIDGQALATYEGILASISHFHLRCSHCMAFLPRFLSFILWCSPSPLERCINLYHLYLIDAIIPL